MTFAWLHRGTRTGCTRVRVLNQLESRRRGRNPGMANADSPLSSGFQRAFGACESVTMKPRLPSSPGVNFIDDGPDAGFEDPRRTWLTRSSLWGKHLRL